MSNGPNPETRGCPFCGFAGVVRGKLLCGGDYLAFHPTKVEDNFWSRCIPLKLVAPEAMACLQCGAAWAQLEPRWLLKRWCGHRAESQEESSPIGKGQNRNTAGVQPTRKTCAFCSSASIVDGKLDVDFEDAQFRLAEISNLFWRWTAPRLPMAQESSACVQCAILWTRLNPEQLREQVQAHGTEELKRRLCIR